MFKKILLIITLLYAAAAFAAVDVNKASAAELDGIKGIGPGISAKILDARKNGDFKDWDDFIARVGGVGEKTAAKYSTEGLTVNGKKFSATAPAKAEKSGKDTKAADKKAKPADAAPAAPAPAPAPVAQGAPKK